MEHLSHEEKRQAVNEAFDSLEKIGLKMADLRTVMFNDEHAERLASYNPYTDRIDMYLAEHSYEEAVSVLEHELLHKYVIDAVAGPMDEELATALTLMEESWSERNAVITGTFGKDALSPPSAAEDVVTVYEHELQLTIMEDDIIDTYTTYADEHDDVQTALDDDNLPHSEYEERRAELEDDLYEEVTAHCETIPQPVTDVVIDALEDRLEHVRQVENPVVEEALTNVYSMTRPTTEQAAQTYLKYLSFYAERSIDQHGDTTSHLEELHDPGPLTPENDIYVDFELELTQNHEGYGEPVAEEMVAMIDTYREQREHGATEDDAIRYLIDTTVQRLQKPSMPTPAQI